MALLSLVVDRRTPLHDLGEGFDIERRGGCRAPDFLGERQDGAAITICHA